MHSLTVLLWLALLDHEHGPLAMLRSYQARVEQMRAEAGRA